MRPGNKNAIDFKINPSKSGKRWLAIAHGCALTACLTVSMPLAIRLFWVVSIGASFIFNVKRYTESKILLRFRSKEGWLLFSNDKEYGRIEIQEGTVCTPFFIIVNFRHRQQKRYLFVLHDAMDKESFRRLMVFLRMYGKKQRG